MKKIIFIIFLSIFMTGCIPKIELKERAMVQAIGVDIEGDEYILTIQVFASESGGQGGFDASKLNNKIIQSRGENISSALRNATLQNGKRIFLGSNNLIVVGKSTAETNLVDIVNFFDFEYDTNPTTMLLISETTASDIVSIQTNQGIVPANSIEMIMERAYKIGGSTRSQLMYVSRAIDSDGEGTYATYVRQTKDFNDKDCINIVGTAIIDDGKFIGHLDLEETRGLLFALGKLQQTIIVVEDIEIGRLGVYIGKSKRKIKVEIVDNTPKFTIDVNAIATISDSITKNNEGLNISQIEKMSKSTEKKIKDEIEKTITKTIRSNGVDLFQFCKYLDKYEKEYWNNNKNDWKNIMKTCEIDVNVKVNFDKIGTKYKKM